MQGTENKTETSNKILINTLPIGKKIRNMKRATCCKFVMLDLWFRVR